MGAIVVGRKPLLSRIAAANPKFLAVVALAGYGKSALVRQLFAGPFERRGVRLRETRRTNVLSHGPSYLPSNKKIVNVPWARYGSTT